MRRLIRSFFRRSPKYDVDDFNTLHDMICDLQVEVRELRRKVEDLEDEEVGTSNALYELENLVESLHPELPKHKDPWD